MNKSPEQLERSLGPVERQRKHDEVWHGRGEQVEETDEVSLAVMSLEHEVSHVARRPRGAHRLPGIRPLGRRLGPYQLRHPHLLTPGHLRQHNGDTKEITD